MPADALATKAARASAGMFGIYQISQNILFLASQVYLWLSHPGMPGVTLCFCTGSYAAAGRRFLFMR